PPSVPLVSDLAPSPPASPGRAEDDGLVAPRGADVGELASAGHVHVQVVRVRVLAADHSLVDRHAWPVEQLPAFLDVEERVRHGLAFAVADDGAVGPTRHLALPSVVAVELRPHDAVAAAHGAVHVAAPDNTRRGLHGRETTTI